MNRSYSQWKESCCSQEYHVVYSLNIQLLAELSARRLHCAFRIKIFGFFFACSLNLKQLCVDPTFLPDNCKEQPGLLCSGRWCNVDWRGCNCVYCVGSPQQQTPDEKAPQPPTHQDWVRRRDHAGAQSGARADVGRHPAGRAADHHVLHRQDHQVGAAVSFRSRPAKMLWFFFLFVCFFCCCSWQQILTDAAFYHLMDRKTTSEVPHVSCCVIGGRVIISSLTQGGVWSILD